MREVYFFFVRFCSLRYPLSLLVHLSHCHIFKYPVCFLNDTTNHQD